MEKREGISINLIRPKAACAFEVTHNFLQTTPERGFQNVILRSDAPGLAHQLNFRSGSEIKVARRDATTESAWSIGSQNPQKDTEKNRWIGGKGDGSKGEQRKRMWKNWRWKRSYKWGAGKHLGPNGEKSEEQWDEGRQEGRINACFFTILPIWDATAGYFASKWDNPTVHIRMLPVVTSRRIYHASFFQDIMGHRYFALSVLLSPKEMRQHSGITNSSRGRVLRDSLTR